VKLCKEGEHQYTTVSVYQGEYEPSLTHETHICKRCNIVKHVTRSSDKADVIPLRIAESD